MRNSTSTTLHCDNRRNAQQHSHASSSNDELRRVMSRATRPPNSDSARRKSTSRQPTSRAQLSRVDEVHSGELAGPAAEYGGAAAFFVDARHSATHYWVYYTTPLTYVERGASVKLASVDGNVVPLPLGTTALRRIGVWLDTARTTVCVLSKAGWYRLANDQQTALRNAELAVEAVGFGATVKGTINM